jgi:hypothetical protein
MAASLFVTKGSTTVLRSGHDMTQALFHRQP